jgi:oxygen-independent coproporphyrinogen-3 oxidase
MESRHNLRYWQRRPYLGLGLDASSMLLGAPSPDSPIWKASVLRSTTTCEMKAFLAGSEPVETTWLAPEQQHEEAWFLGLRLNEGVEVAAVEREFGPAMVTPALKVVRRLGEAGLVVFDGQRVQLTAKGRLLSNEVFQEFLELKAEDGETGQEIRR